MSESEIINIRAGVSANRIRQSVIRGGREVFLSRQLFQILLLVAAARHGASPERIADSVYADDPSGGPLTARKAMCVQRVNLNRKLAPLHLTITSGGAGRRGGVYELAVLPMNEAAVA